MSAKRACHHLCILLLWLSLMPNRVDSKLRNPGGLLATPPAPLPAIPAFLLRLLHPDSVVQSKPAPSGLRLALLSGGTPKLFQQYAFHLASKPCYARRRRYSFLLDPSTALPLVDGLFLREHWRKVLVLQRWLPYFHYVFWMDLDTTIFDTHVRLESFLDQHPGAELLLPQDSDQHLLFSNDVFLLRGGAWGSQFLERWWAARLICPGLHGEQGAMHATLLDVVSDPNASLSSSRCRHLCRLRSTRLQFYACIELGLQQLPPAGPVRLVQVNFTTGNGGLCVNGHNFDHRKYPAMQRRPPFCLHAKRPQDWAGPVLRATVDWGQYRCPPHPG